jgi:hypothetical protein
MMGWYASDQSALACQFWVIVGRDNSLSIFWRRRNAHRLTLIS